jgi:CoA binding domain
MSVFRSASYEACGNGTNLRSDVRSFWLTMSAGTHDTGRRQNAMRIKDAAIDFLDRKRVAVTGVSRHPGNHGSNVVYRRLRDRGYEVFAVNPNAGEVEGDTCYPDLASVPGGVDWVVNRHEARDGRGSDEGVCRPRDRPGLDAPCLRPRQRVGFGCRLRPSARRDGDRRWVSLHVRRDRRPWPQGHARCSTDHPQCAQSRLGLVGI